MRTALFVLCVGLASTTAQAMPKVGDQALFDYTVTQGTQSTKGTFELQLISYDVNKNIFVQRMTQTQAGTQPQVSEENVDATTLITDAQAADVVKNCANYGGKSNTVVVAAGKFKTCDLPVAAPNGEKGIASFSIVPFGEVRQDTMRNGIRTVLELRSYKMAL